MRMIKCHSAGNDETVYINPNNIVYIKQSGEGTKIGMQGLVIVTTEPLTDILKSLE